MENPFAAESPVHRVLENSSAVVRVADDSMISIAGDRFCVPYTLEMTVTRKVQGMSKTRYDVFDSTGNTLLRVDGAVWKIPRKRVMRDPAGLPVLTMRDKGIAMKQKWQIHEGESSEAMHLLCSVVEARAVNLRNEFGVHLAGNSNADPADFHVTGSVASLSFKVRKGKRLLAEVSHNYTLRSLWKGKETFQVKVYPEVDYAFIVALLVIVHENDI